MQTEWVFEKVRVRRTQLLILLFAWLGIQTLLYIHYGVQPILESLKYINAGKYLLTNGHLPELRYYFYLTTTLLITFCLKTGLGFTGVVLFQLGINAWAAFRFYQALSVIQTKSYSALLTTLFLICCIPYQTWNFYLYTESLFYSFTLLFFAQCIQTKQLSFTTVILQTLFLLLVILSRPLGILFLPCWIVYLIAKSGKQMQLLLIVASVVSVLAFFFISNLILGNISDWGILTSAENNEIICDVPVGSKLNLETLKSKPPLAQLYLYITTHPLHFFQLAFKRLYYFFVLARPYYTAFHNLFLYLIDLALYVPVLLSLPFAWKRHTNTTALFSVSIIAIFCTAICLQCDDYHNRFHHAIIPVFLYCGLYGLFEKITSQKITIK